MQKITFIIVAALLLFLGPDPAGAEPGSKLKIDPIQSHPAQPNAKQPRPAPTTETPEVSGKKCQLCERTLNQAFRYCPYDGAFLDGKPKKQAEVHETWRDGNYIAYDNGIVQDTDTGLLWAAKDNGSNIAWPEARAYAAALRLGGHRDWRLPSLEELATLYDQQRTNLTPSTDYCGELRHLTDQINLSCARAWSSGDQDKKSNGRTCAQFNFAKGSREWLNCWALNGARALAVRKGD